MKKILIAGANSYIGTSFKNYTKQWPELYQVDTVDMIDGSWREKSFAEYDSVFHVAGIAHCETKNICEEKKELYYKINTDLAIETATKAKNDGVKQFVFMSSIIVYGDSAPIGKSKVITKDTPVSPSNIYGDSKVKAEKGLNKLNDASYKIVILRPPMVYGKESKGNYKTLSKIAQKVPFFPYIKNERSMIYIENLLEFVRLMIDNEESGLFYPQNIEYTNTSEFTKMIAKAHGKNVRLFKGFTWLFKALSIGTDLINKAFGNLVYDKSISVYKVNYQKINMEKSIMLTEK